MCGRYVLFNIRPSLGQLEGVEYPVGLRPSYNIAPTETALIVRAGQDGAPEAVPARWGLVPSWARDDRMGAKLINARAETVDEKPAFRSAYRKRRCLVVADGFYEWKRDMEPHRPFYFHMKDGQPFTIGGLWEHWKDPEGKLVESFAMITTEGNSLMKTIHERMPVIIPQGRRHFWLDHGVQEPEKLAGLLGPYQPGEMESWPVDLFVNSPKNNDPRCIVPAKG